MSPGLKQNGSIIKNIVWSIPVIQIPFQKGIGNITGGGKPGYEYGREWN